MHGWPSVVTLWHLNSQTVSLLSLLENDIGGCHSCVTICFLVIVPPVQVALEWRQSEAWSGEVRTSQMRVRVRKAEKKWGIGRKRGGLRHKDKCTWHAGVIWSEYETDERKWTHVQFTHRHTVFVFGKCWTGLQCSCRANTTLWRVDWCVCACVCGRAYRFSGSVSRSWLIQGMSETEDRVVIEIFTRITSKSADLRESLFLGLRN